MSDFQTVVTAEDAAPDLSKHVNYVQGMVLGVDDFTQEFAYLNGRIQWLAREAIGYGALSGLRVTVEPTGDGPRVRVAAGAALTPRGELVCVPEDQCALINPWLAENQDQLPPGRAATLYVRLCYKTCATDNLPIPGEPCRSEDELMAPSRIADDFRLELTTTPPDQREEDAVRAFAAWLRSVRLTNNPDEAVSEAQFAQAIREAWVAGGELSGLPPETLVIPTGGESDYLRLALRIWATELLPDMRALGGGCATPPDQGCIALAALLVDMTTDRLEANVREVHDDHAPFLLHLRMLQEWLIAGRHDALPSDTVLAETVYGLAPDAGVAEEYARADHTHGTPPLPELLGDVESSPMPPDSSPPSFPDSSPPALDQADNRIWTTVVAIQGTPVAPDPPTDVGQALVFDGGAWRPGMGGPLPGEDIVAEQDYGQGVSSGEGRAYARADHTHGTPPPPELAGDVTSTPVESDGAAYRLETRVARIYDEAVGVPDAETTPAAGQVLKLIDVGDGALEWRPADDRAGAGGPERGADVVAERLYSQAAGLGESLAYAPSSHTHGTPPAPSFSGEVEIVVAQSTAAVQHYTTRVAGILDFPVEPNAHAPGAGDVLTLTDPGDGKLQWQIGGGGATGSFVVAAGQFDVDGRTVFAHNRLRATQLIPQLPTVYLLSFEEFDPSGRYVVTGAPWTDLDREIPAVFEYIGDARDDKILSRLDNIASNNPALKEVINKFGIERAGILVRVRQINTEPISNGFMVEISRYSE